jgi:uncharacterized cofD-like protein
MVKRASAHRQLRDLKMITAIGGGHGLGRVLNSLMFMRKRLIGVVATTDNGGATGRLRQQQQTIAWGDIRNCLSQLTQQPLAAEVLNFRFADHHELQGHNFGNLLLHTLNQVSARPLDGIALLSRMLNITTRVLPMSEIPVDLVAETHEQLECFGEVHVDQLCRMPRRLKLEPEVHATPEAVQHILQSELILLGPGSFMTSIMPPLLIAEIRQAIADSPAPVVFIDNLIAEQSPAGRLSLSERLAWMEQQLGPLAIDLVITNHADEQLTLPTINSIMPAHDAPHRHDPASLLQALERAVTLLYPYKRG